MPPARWFSPMLVKLLAVLLAAIALIGTAEAQVASNNTYLIGGIDVDITGADAIKAREQGVREAQRRAVKMLVERMVAPEDRAKVPPVDDGRLQALVRGVEFAKERTAGNRYMATLNVVFGAEPVKSWLSEAGIGVVETVSRAALVVPLWKDRNGVEPLDDRNAWRDAWQALDASASSVPVMLVRGDQLDQNALSVEEAYVGDVSALSRLNERYRAPTIIVAVVEGDKERIQIFAGIVIGRKGRGMNETFTVRRISYGEGVERVFPIHSPRIAKVEVEKEGKARRAKLNYLRTRKGKEATAVRE